MEHLKETDINTLQDILEVAKKRYKNHTAVQTMENGEIRNYSYDELYCLIEQYRTIIRKLNLPAETKAVMVGDVSLCWICCYFAVTTTGLCAVPLDKSLPDSQLADMAYKSDASVIIFTDNNEKRRENIAAIEPGIVVMDNRAFLEAESEPAAEAAPNIEKDQDAMMVYTSGTTGESKGVLLSHQNICHDVYCASKRNDKLSNVGARTVPVLPTHHMFQITVGILIPFYTGMTLCICQNPRMFMQSLPMFRPTTLTLVPAIIENLHKKLLDIGPEEFKKLAGNNLTTMKCGGAALLKSVIKDFKKAGIDIIIGYGITECSPVVATNSFSNPKYDTVGKVLPPPYCQVRIINGEICVKGSIVMKGYYKKEAETKKAFIDGWFRTGDLGELNAEGELILTGRIKNLIILSDGNNVSPEELEGVLMNMDHVDEALVKEKAIDGKIMIGAEIYTKELNDAVKQSILDQIAIYNKSVPMYKRIYDISFRKHAFDKTSLGKIRRY